MNRKFVTEQSFWDLFPQAEIAVLTLEGFQNDGLKEDTLKEINELLVAANKEAKKFLVEDTLSANPVVAVWRNAYQQFKKKKDARSSIEALLKRVDKGNEVGTINPIVDIYNAASLNFGFPCGGEDLAGIKGDLVLKITEGGDSFLALGDEEDNPTLPGELAYIDDEGAVCRCWNWRDGQRTMLTEETTGAFLIFESVDPSRHEELVKAQEFLAENLVKYLGGSIKTKAIITKDNREVEI